MGQVTGRTSYTSRGESAFNPWNNSSYTFSVLQLNLGNNFISKLEIVSALNSFNLAYCMYQFYYRNCTEKYNPKVYLGAVQTASTGWNSDGQNGQNWEGKSGSWPQNYN